MGPLNPQDEDLLIRQFKAGDLSTFEIIIKKYQDRIYNLCHYLLGHPQDAEDAAQDVFIKAFRNLKDFQTRIFPLYLVLPHRSQYLSRPQEEIAARAPEK